MSGSMASTYPILCPMSLIPLSPKEVSNPCHPSILVCSGFGEVCSSVGCSSSTGSSCSGVVSTEEALVCGFPSSCFFIFSWSCLYCSSHPGRTIEGMSERSSCLSENLDNRKSPPTHVAAVFQPPPAPPIHARSVTDPRIIPVFFSHSDGLYLFSASASI